jgi:DNA-binding transcriptional MerR regulator
MAEAGPTHLSIGEVLGLLVAEFPDVTISKIRFLESQGLIEPERTPSGYRKFFDDDVELLRLILREQREKFLPLRVIKDRIDSGEIEASADVSPVPESDDSSPQGRERPTTAAVSKHPAARRPSARTEETGAAPAPGPATASAPSADSDGGPPPVAPPPEPPGPAAQDIAAAPRRRRSDDAASASPAPTLLPGVLVNRDELCAMASVTPEELAQLEDYGVVTHRPGSTDLYGDEAVEITAAAGGFLRAGVDARHLRAWRTSVERESGLYEQLILPLLRQRNPQARAQVGARLDELDGLGTKLRAAMMRAALRQYMEG